LTVLSGGACVQLQSVSVGDIDLINVGLRAVVIREAMQANLDERRYHPPDRCSDRVSWPLSIGEELVMNVEELLDTGSRLLSRLTASDRLTDISTAGLPVLEQAVMVALSQPVDLVEIERWSTLRGMRGISDNPLPA
jgi:hypothetical protein